MKGSGFMAAWLLPSSRALQHRPSKSILRSGYGVGRHVHGRQDVQRRPMSTTSDVNACDADQAQLLMGLQRRLRIGSQCRSFSSSAELAVEEGEDGGERQSVMEYLHSLGVDTSALEDVELPKARSIMKERVEYLRNVIGLSVKDINEYPLMIGCSVRKNLSPVVQYLLDLKVTKSSLSGVVRKYPQVLHASVAIDLIPNVRYIQGLGVEPKQVGSLLTRYPQVLGYRIEGTMSTSVAYLVMVGVDKRQIGPVLTEKPEIMGMRVSNNLRPKVEFIASCGIPLLVVGKMIENRPYILDYDVDDKMRPAVDALLELGVRREALPQMLLQFPELLGLKIKDKVEAKLPWLTAKVGVRREDMAAILEKLPQMLVMNVPTGTKRVHALRELGLTKEEVARMIVTCPQLIGLSIEKRISPNGEFLVKEMKRDVKELLEFPAFLTYDLDTRIRPRFERVKGKGITCPLVWMLNCSDAEFEGRLNRGYSLEGSEKVDESFDTVGRLRVHEDVPSDEEPEDKRRTLKQRNRDLLRARISSPNPSPAIKLQEDKNVPFTQSYRDAPRAQATRPMLTVDSSDDEFEADNRMSRQVVNDPPRAQVVDSSDDESEDESQISRHVFKNPRSGSRRTVDPPRAHASGPRSIQDSLGEEAEEDYRSPKQNLRAPPRSQASTPRSFYVMESDEETKDDPPKQSFRDPPRAQASRPRSLEVEAEEDYRSPKQNLRAPPRLQASTPKPFYMDSSDEETKEDPSNQSFRDAPKQSFRDPSRAQPSRPKLSSLMPESSDAEDADDYVPPRPIPRDAPRFQPKHVSMMPDSSEDEFEDEYPSKPIHRGTPRPNPYRPRSMANPSYKGK